MKALIVIEIPEDHFLITANDLYERLKGCKCDLKPMPKHNDYRADTSFDQMKLYSTGYADGWNDCLDEIIGETE